MASTTPIIAALRVPERRCWDAPHALDRSLRAGSRNDAAAMQHLIPGWTFDAKRPALVR